MRLKSIILIILLITAITITEGCSEDDRIIYNNNYPNIQILDVRSTSYDKQFIWDFHNATILVTVKSVDPEKTIQHANGSVSYEGGNRTVPVVVSTEGWWMAYEEGHEHITKIQNVSLAYNETKTLSFSMGDLHRGYWNFTISTPNMNTTEKFSVLVMGV